PRVRVPDGFTCRPATSADAAAVAVLMNAFDRAHLEEPDEVDAAEVSGWWVRLDLERDSRLVFAADGRLAAAGTVYGRTEAVLDLDAFVHPELSGCGLGSALIDWLEQEGSRRERLVLRTSALAADSAAASLIAARGFEPIRHFYRMSIELEEPPPEARWPI